MVQSFKARMRMSQDLDDDMLAVRAAELGCTACATPDPWASP
jgi:hypothetical protein